MTEEKKDFVIRDKRIFSEGSEDGESKEDPKESSKEKPDEKAADKDSKENASKQETQMPKIDFATFIFSLNSSALLHLGMVEDPATGKKEKNLIIAKQTIDILGMLADKTKGNLTDDEDKLLRNILHDLRLMYVKERS